MLMERVKRKRDTDPVKVELLTGAAGKGTLWRERAAAIADAAGLGNRGAVRDRLYPPSPWEDCGVKLTCRVDLIRPIKRMKRWRCRGRLRSTQSPRYLPLM